MVVESNEPTMTHSEADKVKAFLTFYPKHRLPGMIDIKCKGCGQHFPRILKHLQPSESQFKVSRCMKSYSSTEIARHRKKIQGVQNIKHKAKIKEKTRNGGVNVSKQLF